MSNSLKKSLFPRDLGLAKGLQSDTTQFSQSHFCNCSLSGGMSVAVRDGKSNLALHVVALSSCLCLVTLGLKLASMCGSVAEWRKASHVVKAESPLSSGKKKEHMLKMFGPDIFCRGHVKGWGAKKCSASLEAQDKHVLLAEYFRIFLGCAPLVIVLWLRPFWRLQNALNIDYCL